MLDGEPQGAAAILHPTLGTPFGAAVGGGKAIIPSGGRMHCASPGPRGPRLPEADVPHPGFYTKLGNEVLGEVEGYFDRMTRVHLRNGSGCLDRPEGPA